MAQGAYYNLISPFSSISANQPSNGLYYDTINQSLGVSLNGIEGFQFLAASTSGSTTFGGFLIGSTTQTGGIKLSAQAGVLLVQTPNNGGNASVQVASVNATAAAYFGSANATANTSVALLGAGSYQTIINTMANSSRALNIASGSGFLTQGQYVVATTTYTMTTADTGTLFCNTGASGTCVYTLAAPAAGIQFMFCQNVQQQMLITTPSGSIFAPGLTGATRSVPSTSSAQYTSFTVTSLDGTNYVVRQLLGVVN